MFKVSGHSMLPEFKPGSTLIISSIPYSVSSPKIGDVVLFKRRDKMMIKRVKKVLNKKFFVEGDNKKDSLEIGWITKSDITGKVIGKI